MIRGCGGTKKSVTPPGYAGKRAGFSLAETLAKEDIGNNSSGSRSVIDGMRPRAPQSREACVFSDLLVRVPHGEARTVYHSTLRIVVYSRNAALAAALEGVPPLDRFTHEFHIAPSFEPDAGHPFSPSDTVRLVLFDCPAQTALPRVDAIRRVYGADAELVLRLEPSRAADLAKTDMESWSDVWLAVAGRVEPDLIRFRKWLEAVKTRQDLRLSRTWLDTLMDSVPDLIWYKDVRGAHLRVNSAFCDAVGKTREQCEGRGHYYIWDLKKEEYEKGEYVCLETEEIVLRERKTCLFDEKVKSRQGLRQFKTYKSPLFDEHGDIMGTVGIARDVTDLSNMDAEMELLLRSMPFGILIRDMDGRILKVNSKFEEYFHTRGEVLTGTDYEAWKRGLPADAPRRTVENNLEVTLSFEGETSIFSLHEEPIHDVFHTVVGYLCLVRDITMEYTFEQKILHNANTDVLTGLYNRRYFYEHVGNGLGNAPFSLLYVDLDNFKQINDRYGHQVGDAALIAVARILRDSFPDGTIARMGGDEFLIALSGPGDARTLQERAARFLDRLREHCAASETLCLLTASIGITSTQDPSLSMDELIRQSDTALYVSKREGKSRCTIYAPALRTAREQDGHGWVSKFRSGPEPECRAEPGASSGAGR